MFRNLNERYEHVGSLGSGGMSTVYKARDKLLDRIVAIKQLRGELLSEEMVQRFEREAKAYAALKHPNIVSIFDFGTDENCRPFLVMDFIEGTSLDEVIARGAMQPPVILSIFIELLEGLEHAHKKSIIHRDLKPANVMVSDVTNGKTSSTQVKLLDFGIAKIDDGLADEAFRTKAGLVMGSPLYMSPEQAESSSQVDARSDLYSVGCILFEALTGNPPFRAENFMKTIFAHRTAEVPNMSEATKRFGQSKQDIEAIVYKALSKLPAQRYQSASEMKNDLIRLQEKLHKVGEEEKVNRQKPRVALPKGTTAVLVSVISLGVVIGLALWFADLIESYVDQEGKRETSKNPVSKKSDLPTIKGDVLDYWRDYDSQYKIPPGASLKSLIGRQDVLTVSIGSNFPDISRHTAETRVAQLKMLEGLESLPKLDAIVLQNFTITEDDVRRFMKVRNLDTIEFRFCKIPNNVVELFLTRPDLKDIGIKACDQITKRQVDLLNSTNFPNLKTLNLSTNDLNWDDSLQPISTLSKLEYIDLQQTRIKPKHLWSLVKVKTLTRVNVGNNEFNDEACKVLSHMTQLRELELGYTKRITDAGVKELAKLRNLEKLCLEWVPMTDRGLEAIASLPNLKSFDVPGCQKITAKGLANLKKQRPRLQVKDTLTTLNIDGNSFGTIYDPD